MSIIVDVREPEEIKNKLRSKYDVEIKRLDYGDIIIDNICIERKTPEDFVSSIRDGRLFEQAKGMKEFYDVSMILVTGTLGSLFVKSRGMNDNAIIGAVAYLSRKNVNVIFVGSHFYWFINMLILQSTSKSVKKVKTHRLSEDERINVLCSLPKIGIKKAEQLLEKYGTVYNCLCNIDDWISINGIGMKIIENVKKVVME